MKLSGYTTIRNAKSMGYPFLESIKSMLSFCDEVVVLDSSDCQDTIDALNSIDDPKLIVVDVEIPWDAPNHGIYDGQTKAMARSYCTGDVLWQMDADEIVHEDHGPIIREIAQQFLTSVQANPTSPKLLILPVIEFWGPDKIRADINPWKPRMSINDKNITHGIPKALIKIEDGLLYAKHGTDGCDYIDTSMNPVSMMSTYPQQVELHRQNFLQNPFHANEEILVHDYVSMMKNTPGVFHYSWYSIPEKILKYKYFWNNSWKSLYNENRDPNWNPFADKSLNDMQDSEIVELGLRLEKETGGWIFHDKWNGSNRPSLSFEKFKKQNISHPKFILDWIKLVDEKKKQ